MRVIISGDDGTVFASHSVPDAELADLNEQDLQEHLAEVVDDVRAYRHRTRAAQERARQVPA